MSRFLLVLFLTLPLAHAENQPTGDALLRMGIGARAIGMGETFVGVADDVSTIYWNPAGLHQIERSQLAVMHAEWLADTRYEWIGFVQPFGSWFSLGVDTAYLYTGEIPRTVETGSGSYRTDGLFSYTSRVIRVAVGTRSYRHVRAGLAVQIHSQGVDFSQTLNRVPARDASDTSLSLGLLYEPPLTWIRGGSVGSLRVGASLQNVRGRATGLIREGADLPSVLKVGSALQLTPERSPVDEEAIDSPRYVGGTMILATDLAFSNDRPFAWHTGIEYHFPNGFTLRGGYRTGADFDFLSSWSLGAGYASGGYELDYSVTPFGRLGNSHRVSMKLDF